MRHACVHGRNDVPLCSYSDKSWQHCILQVTENITPLIYAAFSLSLIADFQFLIIYSAKPGQRSVLWPTNILHRLRQDINRVMNTLCCCSYIQMVSREYTG